MVYCKSPHNKLPEEPRMLILHSLLSELKDEFSRSRKGEERGAWFIHTLVAIILPFTSSKTSNLLRALANPVWVYRHQLETLLPLHGLPEDSLGPALAKDLEDDS